MQTIRNILMSYIVKLLVPESPAYGNTIPFVKQQATQSLISKLEVCDIIFTRTNSSWYQLCRRFLGIRYDHVSVVISRTEVIHVSPPIISKLQLPHILNPTRQPLILRLSLTTPQKQSILTILTSFLGQKYNESAIPTIFKNELLARIFEAQKDHQFVFQNLKYSKICTQAIMYALGKGMGMGKGEAKEGKEGKDGMGRQGFVEALEEFVKGRTGYKRLGYVMPDEFLAFLQTRNPNIIHRSPQTPNNTYLQKAQQTLQSLSTSISTLSSPILSLPPSLKNNPTLNILAQITKNTSNYLLKQHPLIKILNLAIIVFQMKYGGKFNRILLVETVVAVLVLWRAVPDQEVIRGVFKKLAKL